MDSELVLKKRNIRRYLKTITLIVLLAPAAVWADDAFVRPPALEPDIAFWRQVFAEVTSDQALLHDSRHLNVVYEVVEIPENASPTRRRRIADLSRERYRNILEKLAGGVRAGLNGEEQRVLALWPADVSDEELRQAAKRIRFQQGLSDRFLAGLKRSGAWKPYIEQKLSESGVPVGLAALPHVESSFNPEARSHVGAAGLWQFTRSTGQRFMEIDHVIDERRDPFRSSESAAELLAYNYSILKSWPLAITAYNHGVGGMRRAVRTLKTEDMAVINREYSGRTFGFASRNFYVAFLAALEVQQNSESYFGPVEMDKPRADLVIELPSYVPAATLSKALGMSQETLKTYNPALLDPIWDGTKYVPRGYTVRVPEKLVDITESEVLAAIPSGQRFARQTPDMYHKVGRGESLSVIAARYGTTSRELVSLNNLKSKHRIRAGQTLRLPFAGVSIPEGADVYTVKNGDSLSLIASRAGISEQKLLEMNKLSDKNRIYIGQVLYLAPDNASTETVAPVTAEVVVAEVAASPASVEKVVSQETGVTAAEAGLATESAATPTLAVLQDDASPAVADEADASTELAQSVAEESVVVTESEAEVAAMVSLADPSDYSVADDNTIEILAAETLGHYADWLNVRAQRLRDINQLDYSRPVVVGRRIALDFSQVSAAEFTAQRVAHHRGMQEAFFVRYRVTDTTEHKLKEGESVWRLAQKHYKVPVWLLLQYNPDLDFGRVQTGMRIVFPRIERVDHSARVRHAVADAS
jgi:membrane-bound lytic murein transglycosylase D